MEEQLERESQVDINQQCLSEKEREWEAERVVKCKKVLEFETAFILFYMFLRLLLLQLSLGYPVNEWVKSEHIFLFTLIWFTLFAPPLFSFITISTLLISLRAQLSMNYCHFQLLFVVLSSLFNPNTGGGWICRYEKVDRRVLSFCSWCCCLWISPDSWRWVQPDVIVVLHCCWVKYWWRLISVQVECWTFGGHTHPTHRDATYAYRWWNRSW